uniref:Uncharacterized protein n=1 Tax=Pavo cristatus TaxID=9049 RepID=A0A8C9G0Q9_PAVCR
MSSDRQRSDDESPSTSSGSSDADQRDPPAPEPEEQEERKPSATQQKKNTKLSSKTTAKLSTSAKRYLWHPANERESVSFRCLVCKDRFTSLVGVGWILLVYFNAGCRAMTSSAL